MLGCCFVCVCVLFVLLLLECRFLFGIVVPWYFVVFGLSCLLVWCCNLMLLLLVSCFAWWFVAVVNWFCNLVLLVVWLIVCCFVCYCVCLFYVAFVVYACWCLLCCGGFGYYTLFCCFVFLYFDVPIGLVVCFVVRRVYLDDGCLVAVCLVIVMFSLL